MNSRERKMPRRREVTRVLVTLTRGPRGRATMIFVGRDLAFDASEETTG